MEVTWLPYELHPEAPAEGIPREVYFGRERSARIHSHLQSVADSVGLTMEPRDVIINSRRALGAAEFAREAGKFEEMHHALFRAHWGGAARLENVDDLPEHLVRLGAEDQVASPEHVGRDGVDPGRARDTTLLVDDARIAAGLESLA